MENKTNILDYDSRANDYILLKPEYDKSIRSYSVRYYDLWNGTLLKYDKRKTLLNDFNKLKSNKERGIKQTAYCSGFLFYYVKATNSIIVYHRRREFAKVMAIFERLTGRNMSKFKNYS